MSIGFKLSLPTLQIASEFLLLQLQNINHEKCREKIIIHIMFSTLYPHYIQILLIHCILLSKEILPIPNIISKNVKNASQFLKEELCLQQAKILAYLAYLLQSEFQTIICMLVNQSSLPFKLLMSKKNRSICSLFQKTAIAGLVYWEVAMMKSNIPHK